MSRSDKTPAATRHGGPGASHEDATKPPAPKTPPDDHGNRSSVSGGGGERDTHHTRDERLK